MENLRQFSGETEADIWQQITADLDQQGDILEYNAQVNQQGHEIYFNIDIDLGGGFESGFETTTFMAPVSGNPKLKFHLHPQDWVNEIGKALGLEDIELGYPELDEAFIIKTNEPETLKLLFSDSLLRQTMLKFNQADFKLAPVHHEPDSEIRLSLNLDQAITNPTDLQEIYHLFLTILTKLEPSVKLQA